MKIKYLISILIIVMLFFMIICTYSETLAASNYSCEINISCDKTEIKAGEKVTLDVKATNINAGDGIVMCQFNIEYDSSEFSCNVLNSEKWSKISLEDDQISYENDAVFMRRENIEATKSDEVMAKIELTANNDASLGNKTISIKKIVITSDDSTLIPINDKSVGIMIVKDETPQTPEQYSCNVEISRDKAEIKAGETVALELKATNINAGDGIVSCHFNLIFNESDFTFKIEGNDKWIRQDVISNTVFMQRKDFEPSSEDQVIAKIILTAKSNISVGNKDISLENIIFTPQQGSTFRASNKSVRVSIVENNEGGQNSNKESDTNKNQGSNPDTESKNKYSAEKNTTSGISLEGTTTSDKALPHAGISGFIKLLLFILISGIAAFSYNRYKKLRNI